MLLASWKYAMLYLYILYILIYYQQMSNWLFGHYEALATLLGKLHQ